MCALVKKFIAVSLSRITTLKLSPLQNRQLLAERAKVDREKGCARSTATTGEHFTAKLAGIVSPPGEECFESQPRILTHYGLSHGRMRGHQRRTFRQYSSYSAPNLLRSVGSSYRTTKRWTPKAATTANAALTGLA